jgi:hypothetical protein
MVATTHIMICVCYSKRSSTCLLLFAHVAEYTYYVASRPRKWDVCEKRWDWRLMIIAVDGWQRTQRSNVADGHHRCQGYFIGVDVHTVVHVMRCVTMSMA